MNKVNILVFKFALALGGGERFNFVFGKEFNGKYKIKFYSNYLPFLKKLRSERINAKKIYWGKEVGARRYLPGYYFLLPINILRFIFVLLFNKKRKSKNIVIFQSLNEKIFATRLAKFFGYKVFWIEHLSIKPWLIKNKFKKAYIKRSRMVDKIIVISEVIKKELIEELNIDSNKVEVVYTGIDLDDFYPLEKKAVETKKKEFGFYKESKIVGYVGRLHREKGIDVLIHAFSELAKRFDPIYLIVIGQGPERKNLEELVFRLGLERKVLFFGYREDISVLVNMMDVFVLPSSIRESFGIALIEAMAAAKVVVASNIGGIPEIIKDKENGFLFDVGKERQLSDLISRVLSDEKLKDKIEKNALRTVREKFSKEKMISDLENILLK